MPFESQGKDAASQPQATTHDTLETQVTDNTTSEHQ